MDIALNNFTAALITNLDHFITISRKTLLVMSTLFEVKIILKIRNKCQVLDFIAIFRYSLIKIQSEGCIYIRISSHLKLPINKYIFMLIIRLLGIIC